MEKENRNHFPKDEIVEFPVGKRQDIERETLCGTFLAATPPEERWGQRGANIGTCAGGRKDFQEEGKKVRQVSIVINTMSIYIYRGITDKQKTAQI